MKRVLWIPAILAGLLIFGAGIATGRYLAQSQQRQVVSSNDAVGNRDNSPSAATTMPVRSDDPGERSGQPRLTPSTPANTASGSTGKVAAMKRSRRTSGGPQGLREEDAALLKKWEGRFHSIGGSAADWLDLLDNEEQDESARKLEQLIAQAIRVHGDRLTDLRMSPPRCTRSVCGFRAVGPSKGAMISPDPNKPTGFMKLVADIGNEPWFTSSFDNVQSSLSVDGDQMVYLAMFLRCEPGTCRGGRG